MEVSALLAIAPAKPDQPHPSLTSLGLAIRSLGTLPAAAVLHVNVTDVQQHCCFGSLDDSANH